MGALRVLQTSQVTLTRVFTVDGVPADASGNVDVAVARWDGTVVSSGTATHPGGPGTYTYTLTGGDTDTADTYQLDLLTVTWTATVGGARTRFVQEVEVCGGFFVDLGQFRIDYPDFAQPARWPLAKLAAARTAVEEEIEEITWRAFVPRFAVDVKPGSGNRWLGLDHCEPRTVRAVTVAGVAWAPSQLATLTWTKDGVLILPDGGVWPMASQVVVEYEHGLNGPPGPVGEAAAFRLTTRLGAPKAGIPYNAQSYTTEAGAIYRLSAGGKGKTGAATVDSDLAKYTRVRRAGSA